MHPISHKENKKRKLKRLRGRAPVHKPTQAIDSKKKYNRNIKHKQVIENEK